jgi:hypothetical protein
LTLVLAPGTFAGTNFRTATQLFWVSMFTTAEPIRLFSESHQKSMVTCPAGHGPPVGFTYVYVAVTGSVGWPCVGARTIESASAI